MTNYKIVFLLQLLSIVTSECADLRLEASILSSQRLRKTRRLGIVIVVAVAVLLPTVDPISLVFEAVPLLLLYEGSIWLCVLFERRWEKAGVLSWRTSWAE